MSRHPALIGVHALVEPTSEVGVGTSHNVRVQGTRAGASAITVEVARGIRLNALAADWRDLNERADAPNVFMDPAIAGFARACYPGRDCVALLAWRQTGPRRQLVGIWTFAIGRASHSIMPLRMLIAPPMPHGYLATPVIDRDCLDAVFDAMLAHIAADPGLPKTIALDAMGTDTATMQALSRVLAARGSSLAFLARARRPMLASDRDGKAYFEQALSSSTRKKLRQHRRRLSEKGVLRFEVVTGAAAIDTALADFLTLEASGWKGRQGTALLDDPRDAAFARAMIAHLAAQGEAAIHRLTLDGRPVSMQIVLRAGTAAFTWKTAYDEALHDMSPGMLLFEDYTAAFLADKSIASVDSCAFDETSFMAAWTERAAIAQLWFDARPGPSPLFIALSGLHGVYLALRTSAKAIYRKYKASRHSRAHV